MRRGTLVTIIALAAAREKPTSRAARRARKAWLNGTKPPTLKKNLLHALAAALRRVAPHGSERDGVLDVLQEARDGCGPRIAWTRLVLQRNTIKHSTLEGASRL